MNDPWETLGLPPTADEAAARERYLALVREHPPERDPERFAEIRAAYEELRDPLKRLSRQIFSPEEDAIWEQVAASVLTSLVSARRIPTTALLSLGEQA